MIWRWEVTLACGHAMYGKGHDTQPNPGDQVYCPACKSYQDMVGRIYGQNW